MISAAPASQQEHVRTHFDRVAEQYCSFYEGPSSEAHSFRMRLNRALEMLPPQGGTLVDIGCGPGLFLQRVWECASGDRSMRIIGVDHAVNMVRQAAQSIRKANGVAGIVLCAAAEQLPFQTASVDTAVCMGLMEYLDDEGRVLRELARILRPGAWALITVPNRWSPYRMWHRCLNRLFALLRARFPHHARLARIECMVGPFTPGISHREYSECAYARRLGCYGLEPVEICAYNFKLFLTPLDKLFPRATVGVSRQLERLGRIPLARLLATAFIIKVRKAGTR